jgi:hypothetical protein
MKNEEVFWFVHLLTYLLKLGEGAPQYFCHFWLKNAILSTHYIYSASITPYFYTALRTYSFLFYLKKNDTHDWLIRVFGRFKVLLLLRWHLNLVLVNKVLPLVFRSAKKEVQEAPQSRRFSGCRRTPYFGTFLSF